MLKRRPEIHLHLHGKDMPIESGAQNGVKYLAWTDRETGRVQGDRKGSMRAGDPHNAMGER